MLSLSTAFFDVQKNASWPKILAETRKLGFESLELNVEIPEKMLPQIEDSVGKGEIKISSLHNYCPMLENLPPGRTVYSGYLLTSDDEEERKLAVKYTLRTVDRASRLGAGTVVVHAGEVPTEPSSREFYRYVEQFGHSGKLYTRYLDALLKERREKAGRYLDILMAGLDEILSFASGKRITVGLENRFFLSEIPNIEEAQMLLEKFSGSLLGYWHDTGHAEVFVRQGWVEKHTDFLDAFKHRTAGAHLHDLRKLSDHYAPGSGDFDFSVLKPYFSDVPVKVVEAHPKSSFKEVQNSVSYLKKLGLI